MGMPDLPQAPSALPPPADLADTIIKKGADQNRRKLRSQMGLQKFFQPGGSGVTPPTPANMGNKTLLGQ